MSPKLTWIEYTQDVASAFDDFQANKISMEDAYEAVDSWKDEEESDIVEFLGDSISEIGGFPTSYEHLQKMLSNNATPADIRNYMNSPS